MSAVLRVAGSFRWRVHRVAEALAVEFSALARPISLPELRALVRLAELERSLEEGHAVVEVVAAIASVGRAAEPADGAHAQLLELAGVVSPSRAVSGLTACA